LLRTQNEELQQLCNEMDVRCAGLKRDLTARRADLETLAQVKEAELKQIRQA
jgi:hypothetical protein